MILREAGYELESQPQGKKNPLPVTGERAQRESRGSKGRVLAVSLRLNPPWVHRSSQMCLGGSKTCFLTSSLGRLESVLIQARGMSIMVTSRILP